MSLAEVRTQIDGLDDQIVGLLAQRQELVRTAARFKIDEAAVRGADRRAAMMQRLRARAAAVGLEPEVVVAVYTAMVDAFVQLELREHRATRE